MQRVSVKRVGRGFFVMLPVLGGATAWASDWSAYQHDAQHVGRSDAAFDPRELKVAWSSPSGYYFPSVVGQTVYATRNAIAGQLTNPNGITAFDLRTGTQKWAYTPPSGTFMSSQAVVANGLVTFVGQTTAGAGSGPKVFVLDGNTGAPLYAVPVPSIAEDMPTILPITPSSARLFFNQSFGVTAVDLGPSSGSLKWSTFSPWGTVAVPTVGGGSVFSGSTGQFMAFDQNTGALYRFHDGAVSGGGGSIPAFDPDRSRIYIRDAYHPSFSGIAAYDYTDNSSITRRWTYAGPGAEGRAGVAIGPDGTIYSASESTLVSLNPDTGAVVHETPITDGLWDTTPVLSSGYVWITTTAGTKIYDAASLAYVTTVPVIGGIPIDPRFTSPGLFFGSPGDAWTGFISNGGSNGFTVLAVPEPSTPALLALAGAGAYAAVRRSRSMRRPTRTIDA